MFHKFARNHAPARVLRMRGNYVGKFEARISGQGKLAARC
ncbi:MAG: hypothetical protein OJF62_002698 [Pseudolabrys sp.]|nr:hypothetical protein [Pseudolabrys sp.]